MRRVGVTILVIAILAVAWSIISRQGQGKIANDAEESFFSLKHGDTTYYGTKSSNVGVVVLGVRSGPFMIGSFENFIRADGKFILVSVAISNQQSTAIRMNTSLFEILDSNGNAYSASERTMEIERGDDLFLALINPGVTKTGVIAFDVPQNLQVDDLRLRFRGGMTGHSAVVALRVNSSTEGAIVPSVPTVRPAEGENPLQQGAIPQPDLPKSAAGVPLTQVKEGQTPEEVIAILGPPLSATTGAQHVYEYRHLRVLFIEGKVSQIQQF